MKKAAVLVIIAALAAAANAQYGQQPSGVSLRGGMFFPTAASAKAEGKTWFGVGVEYKLKDLSKAYGPDDFATSYSISVDYYGKGDHSNMPVLLNWVSRGKQLYYSAGAGLGFAKTPDGLGGSDTGTELSFQFSAGYEFKQGMTPFFVEARYFGSAESALNGYGIFAGVRF
ncbi:MAG: hypothetical protein WD716_08195 [Fimbriimonadaceae bacterium]